MSVVENLNSETTEFKASDVFLVLVVLIAFGRRVVVVASLAHQPQGCSMACVREQLGGAGLGRGVGGGRGVGALRLPGPVERGVSLPLRLWS